MKPAQQILGHLAATFTISVWGITFISTKFLLGSFTPVEIMAFRLALALLALFAVSLPSLAHSKLDRQSLRDEWKFVAAGFCGVTLFFLCQNIALAYTLTANVSVLLSVAPLFTALVSRAAFKEKLAANFFLGFTVAMIGIILIAFNGSVVLKLNPLGDLLSIVAALGWACYSALIRKINAPPGALLAVTRKVFFYGLLLLVPLLPLVGFRLGLERLTVLPNLLNLLFLGAVASALCFATWNYAVQRLGPVKTSAYIYVVPVVTIVASLLLLREPITLVAGIGMALILTGMMLSERGPAVSSPA